MFFLGIDLGTSGMRGLLVDKSGLPLGSAESHYPVYQDHSGWSEQNPDDWISALSQIIEQLKKAYPYEFAKLKGIGVSGQMHGATLIDEHGEVLRRCILWNDTRSHKEAHELDSISDFRAISGNIVFPGFTAPKLKWVANNEPDIFSKIYKVLLPKDYLNYWMSGCLASDMSDSAGTSWLDTGKRDWSDGLLTQSNMKLEQMPKLFEGNQLIGTLKTEIAKKWGVTKNVNIVAGAGDNAAAASGVGILKEGQGFVSLGTSGVVLVARNGYHPAADTAVHTFCHAVPDRWYQMGVSLAATDSLNWLAKNLESDASSLSERLGAKIEMPGSIKFLPYLSGERTPHNDSQIRGAFLNLDIASDQIALTKAVMEGVAFALNDCLQALKSTGAKVKELYGIGGGSRSKYWVELLATIMNTPIQLPESGEFGAALGAARLAISGSQGVEPDKIMSTPKIAKTILPNQELVQAYKDAYHSWREIYPAIKDLT